MTSAPRELFVKLFTDGWHHETVSVLADWCEEAGFAGWAYRLRTDPKELGVRWVTEVLGPMNWALFAPDSPELHPNQAKKEA